MSSPPISAQHDKEPPSALKAQEAAAPTERAPAAFNAAAFAPTAAADTDAKAAVTIQPSAPAAGVVTVPAPVAAPAPVSQLNLHSPVFTPTLAAATATAALFNPKAPSFNPKPAFVFKPQATEFNFTPTPAAFPMLQPVSVPHADRKFGGPATAPFQPQYNHLPSFEYAPPTALPSSFAPYTGPALNNPYGGLGSYAPAASQAASPPAAPSLMMNQFGQWVPAYPATGPGAYPAQPAPAQPHSYRAQPIIVPPPAVIINSLPQPQPQPQQPPHSLQLQAKFGKQRKGAKHQQQQQSQHPQQQLQHASAQFPHAQQQMTHPPLPFAPVPASAVAAANAAGAAASAPAEPPLSKTAQKKLTKQKQKQEQKVQKQQQQQLAQQAQLQRRSAPSDAAAVVSSVPAPAAATAAPALAASAAVASRIRPRNPPVAASAGVAATDFSSPAPAPVPAPASAALPARHQFPAAVSSAPQPSAEFTCVGYFGSPRSSHGMHATKRSMGHLINALCGRDVFNTARAAYSTPFAQKELRGIQRRPGSAPTVDNKVPIRLGLFEPLPMLDEDAESLNSPSLSPMPIHTNSSASPPPSSVLSSPETLSQPDIVSEDVSVALFAEIQMAVDTRSRIIHMHLAEPAGSRPPAGGGLSLGLDAPLGFERVEWMEELARLPLSVLQSMDESSFHRFMVTGTSQQLRLALFVFCTAHHIVIAHPAAQLQIEWIEALRLLAALKSKLYAAFANSGDAAATSADASACASLYRSLLSGLCLSDSELKLLSSHSSGLPLCFTPSVSFVVQPPSFLLGRAWDERKVAQFTENFHAQLVSLCGHFGLAASHAASADVSPAASAPMLLFKAGPQAPADTSSSGISTARFYKPSHRQHKNAIAASEEQQVDAADTDGDASAPVHLHSPPLFFLHTQQPVISTDFAALFGEHDEVHDWAAAKDAVGAESASLVSLRSTLERSIFVARAHIDSLHASWPREGLSSGTGMFTAERQIRCMQVLHAWIADLSSPVAAALDSTLLQTLHVDFQFSAARCEHAAAVAKKIYFNAQQNAANARASAATPPGRETTPKPGQEITTQRIPTPEFYSAQAHRQRLETVVRLFHNLAGAGTDDAAPSSSAPAPPLSPSRAVGPAVAAFESALRRDLESYWLQSHRGCDATSVFGHACVLPHGHAEQSIDNIAASSWPVEHAAVTHSLRLSCHCGASLLKLAKEPFDVSALRIALTDRCCMAIESIGRQVFSGWPVDGSNGWNLFRSFSGYNPATGFAHLAGFYPKAARTSFLPSVQLMLPDPHAVRIIEVLMGLEFECPLGHRWIQPDVDDEAHKEASPTHAATVGPVCRGFPRRDTFLFLPCLICRYLRHLQQKAASDSVADARQKRLHAEEKRGRAMLQQREEKKDEQQRAAGSIVSASFTQPAVPSSTVRSHDRYAQLRRLWVVTPSTPMLTLNAHIKSTRLLASPPAHPTPGLVAGSTTVTQPFERMALMRGESTGTCGAAQADSTPTDAGEATRASRSRGEMHPSLVASCAGSSLVHSRDSSVSDNFSPLSGASLLAGSPRPTLPPSSTIAIEFPYVLTRGGQCLSSAESKYCILQSHMLTPM